MLRPCLLARHSGGSGGGTLHSLGRLPLRSRPGYPQQQHQGQKLMDRQALLAAAMAPHRRAALATTTPAARLPASSSSLAQQKPPRATKEEGQARNADGDSRRRRGTATGAARLAARLRGDTGWPHAEGGERGPEEEVQEGPRRMRCFRLREQFGSGTGGEDRRGAQPQLQPHLTKRAPGKQRPRFVEAEEDEAAEALLQGGMREAALSTGAVNTAAELLLQHGVEDDDVILETPTSLLKELTRFSEDPAVSPPPHPSFTDEVRRAKAKHAATTTTGNGNEPQQQQLDADQPQLRPDSDDDVVVDPYVEARIAQHQHPAARGIAQDVVDLVTDAFKQTREREIERRRKALYELTHPNPSDYTYGAKLVPPPPLHFGKVTEEAVRLGEELMVKPQYTLVNQAGVRAEPRGGKTAAAPQEVGSNGSSSGSTLAGGMIEVHLRSPATTRRQGTAATPHRSRKQEDNIFRDHSYFFEINELYQEIVVVGRASAGKSSLVNALLGQPSLAKTSSTPNTTRKINFYQSVSPEELRRFHEHQHHNQLVKLPGGGLQLTFVDMPGYGIEGMSDAWRDAAIELTDAYFGVRRSVNTVLFCVDCERGLTKTDVTYFKWLENVQGVFYVVLTKCDSVPHSRICSVMRQIYVLITKNRRKFRKVFPYIIPVSAKDGTNLDMLRGLITETSGMIPGDKLRDLLKHKKETTMEQSLALEALRLARVRELERELATAQFLETYKDKLPEHSPLLAPTVPAEVPAPPSKAEMSGQTREPTPPQTSSFSTDTRGPPSAQKVFEIDLASGTLRHSTTPTDFEGDSSINGNGETQDVAPADGEERRRQRERFLSWRQANPLDTVATPYGSLRYRLNTGLENPLADSIHLAYEEGGGREGEKPYPSQDQPPPPPPSPTSVGSAPDRMGTSRIIGLDPSEPPHHPSPRANPAASAAGGGKVSQFLATLEQFGNQTRRERPHRLRRWRQSGSTGARLLTEDGKGRLVASQGGRHVGPALTSVNTDVANRQAAWKAQQLKELLWKENAEAPWEAMQTLSKKLEHEKQQALMGGMRRGEQAAYLRNAGKVTESFEKFEGEVTTAKYMNEVRVARTARSQAQMHLNATAKINYRSMPPGLWKQYGQQDTYWPTPRVLGRENDESHEREHSPKPAAHAGARGKTRRGGRGRRGGGHGGTPHT